MILIDTSVWADHLRKSEPALTEIGRGGEMVMHPFVIGELAAGHLPNWEETIAALRLLPRSPILDENGYYQFVSHHGLMASGLSFVDIHLLASVVAMEGGRIWTRDKRLAARADAFGLLYTPA